MKIFGTVFLFFILFNTHLFSQISYVESDSAFVMSYQTAEKLKHKIENQKKQIDILIRIGGNQDLIIKKLQLRDSLHYLEIKEYEKMDSILREKVDNYSRITLNYKTMLLSTEEKLRVTEIQKDNEKDWKNIYKYGYPVLAIIVGTLLLTK